MAIYNFRTNQTLVDSGFNQASGGTLTLSGNSLISNTGTFRYINDMSSTYVARSIVDAEYVTGLTNTINYIGESNQIIYHGVSGLTGATNLLYNPSTSGLTVSNLTFSTPPETDIATNYFLTWDDSTGEVTKIGANFTVGLSSAINGLHQSGTTALLGGLLTQDTKICGGGYSFCINNSSCEIVLDNQQYGGLYLKSQSGSISNPNAFTSGVGFGISYNDGFKVHDNRIGSNRVGIEYASNYAPNYTLRSLVDKGYVQAVVAGLQPHDAVQAASTGNTILTGLTSPVYVDGLIINPNTSPNEIEWDRVLLKNQDDASENGIYNLTTVTGGTGTTYSFIRATDFDESSESIQGAYMFVFSGNTNADTSWILTTPNPITIDVDALTFNEFNQVNNLIAGEGIKIVNASSGTTISVDGDVLNTVNVCNINVNYTATTNSSFIGISGGTNICVTLPSISKLGQKISISDMRGTALNDPIEILCNNNVGIMGGNNAIIGTDYGSVTFINNGVFWSASAFIN